MLEQNAKLNLTPEPRAARHRKCWSLILTPDWFSQSVKAGDFLRIRSNCYVSRVEFTFGLHLVLAVEQMLSPQYLCPFP